MAKVNVNKLYFALLTTDEIGTPLTSLIFETPEYIPGVRQIDAKSKVSTEKLYAEGKVWETDSTLEEISVDIDLAELSNASYAKYLGHNMATLGGAYSTDEDKAPYLAVLFEATKSNGKKAYRVYYKGKLEEPSENAKTKEGKTDYQTHKVTATFQALKNNGIGIYKVDEDDLDCPVGIATSFFATVNIPTLKVGI